MGDFRPRTVWLGHPEKREQRYPRNVINNQKYNFFTFLPGVSVRGHHCLILIHCHLRGLVYPGKDS